jgi:hypothetical protein
MSGSDKHSAARDGNHCYGPAYERAFRPFKYRRVSLLEIGIGGYENHLGGASLFAWRSYFPRGTIVGCDIVDKRALARPGVVVEVVDQSDDRQLLELDEKHGPFDIVIDDGSHLNEHQISTFKTLFPRLKDDGVYVVEDVQTSYWPSGGGAHVQDTAFAQTCVGWFCRLIPYLNHPEFAEGAAPDDELLGLARQIGRIWFEHNLIVIEKDTGERRSNVPAAREMGAAA